MRLHVYLPDELVAKVDQIRGDIPRSKFMQRSLEASLKLDSGGPSDEVVRMANDQYLGKPPNRADAFRRLKT